MKIVELLNKISLPITNEESDVLGRFESAAEVFKKDLNIREQYIANGLVNKDILTRKRKNGKIYYRKKV